MAHGVGVCVCTAGVVHLCFFELAIKTGRKCVAAASCLTGGGLWSREFKARLAGSTVGGASAGGELQWALKFITLFAKLMCACALHHFHGRCGAV